MSLHYVKILFRNLRRDRTFAILNFLGLSVGLVAFILIILYVRYESSFDGYHQDDEQIYRVIKQEHDNYYYGTDFFAVTQGPLAAALEDDFPEVEQAGRVWYQSDVVLGVDDRKKLEPRVYGIDPAIFSIFSFEVLEGTIAAFAERKNAMVITATTARRLFGDGKALGQTIRYRNEHLFEVVAVIADMPDNSHFQMQVMIDFTGMAAIENHNFERWNNSSIYTYLKLTSGADPEELAGKLPAFVERYITAAGDNETSLYLEPLRDIYLRSQANFQLGPTNDIRRLRIYVLIAILILVIACINYVNLSTAKSVKRAKEVGVRKSIGASRRDLIGQFLGESFLHTGLALLFALMLISIVLPSFSQFTGSHLDLNIETYQWLIPFLVGTCLLVTILAGLYPAFVLSAFRPIAVLKGNLLQLQRKVSLRRILVITQFTVSAVLIIGAVVISRQLAYVQEKDVGYAKEQIVIVKLRDERFQGNDLSTLKRELRSLSIADRVASGSSLPNNLSSNSGAQWPGKPAEIDVSLYTAYVDEEYLPLFGMNLADGNHFSPEGEGARGGVILNEKAVEALGWNQALGRPMITWNGDTTAVIGIIKDFHQHSLHLAIAPTQLFFGNSYADHIAIKLNTNEFDRAIKEIKSVYDSFGSDYPFEYHFFDEVFASDYKKDHKTLIMANWATSLIMFIACLGLYGLSLFRAESRRKEIGVRKVLGASFQSLLMLLSKEFLLLTLISFAVAIPVSQYIMQHWLSNFAYHIKLDGTHFLFPLLAILSVAALTVGYHTFHVAASNPIEALREE